VQVGHGASFLSGFGCLPASGKKRPCDILLVISITRTGIVTRTLRMLTV